MKNRIILPFIFAFLLQLSCDKNVKSEGIYVKNIDALNEAIGKARPGSKIILANGIWKDVQINFYGNGTKEKPITIRAETEGEVFIEGKSFVHLGGENLIVNGLYFRNGYTPSSGVIRYKIGLDSIANNSTVTNCVIERFNKPRVIPSDQWIEFYGKHNSLKHCYIAGKTTDGPTLMVYHEGNENTNNHHQIVNNYFGSRPRNDGLNAETIQLGDSKTRLTPGRVNVSNNYFEACNGDAQVISDMTNYNMFAENIFYKCEGSLVLRHGNFATVNRNIFIGGDESNLYGGLSVLNTGHWITNNYFYKIRGKEFRSPLAIMNGIKNTPLQGFRQVTDVVIAYNTWVNCESTWQIGVGQNKKSADVLPVTELRSEPPIRSTIANNLIYNTQVDTAPVINYDDMSGILFRHNIIDNNGSEYSEYSILQNEKIKMKQVNQWLFAPKDQQNKILDDTYTGYDFGKIKQDLFGNTRATKNRIGAISNLSTAEKFVIDTEKYGPKWFSTDAITISDNISNSFLKEVALKK